MIFSIFRPKIISEVESKFSGTLKVIESEGSLHVSSGYLTQSGGLVKTIWQPVIKKYGRPDKTWLILGLATGTVAKLLPDPSHIIGVEIDPAMLDIGYKYFDLGEVPNLEVINVDAQQYIKNTRLKFDFVLVDLYLGDTVPTFVYDLNFLKQLKTLSPIVIFNHLFYDEPKKAKAQKLIKTLESLFPTIKLQRILTNLMIICKNISPS